MNSGSEDQSAIIRADTIGWAFTACVLVLYMLNLLTLHGSIAKFTKMFESLHLVQSWETRLVFAIGDVGYFIILTIVAVTPLLIMTRCAASRVKLKQYVPIASAALFCLLMKLYLIAIYSGLSQLA